MIFEEYKKGINDWKWDNQDAYMKIRRAISAGVQDFDDAMAIYAYAFKSMEVKPSGIILYNLGSIVRKIQKSRTQLYWAVVRMAWRGSLYWGCVFTIGFFMSDVLEMVVKAWLLDETENMDILLVKEIHRQAIKCKDVAPYKRLEGEIFTNSLLLGISDEHWQHGDIERWLLIPLEELKIIKNTILKNENEK